jgi:hypothetical protein
LQERGHDAEVQTRPGSCRPLRTFPDLFYTAGVVLAMLLLVGPVEIYVRNPNEFVFAFLDVLPVLLLACLLLAALVASVLSFLPGRLLRPVFSVGCGIAFLLWVQGNVLRWQYGPLNGKSIDWTSHTAKAGIEAALWLLVLSGCVVAAQPIFTRRRVILNTLLAMNVMYTTALIAAPPGWPERRFYHVDDENEFTFSSKQNVIVVLVDTFQTDVFQEIINDRPDVRKIFHGFTYYRNSVGGFSLTLPSVPLMLTGQYYDNTVPYAEFVKRAYSHESVPGVLRHAGYAVDLFPSSLAYLAFDHTTASNVTEGMNYRSRVEQSSHLIDLSLFRYAPHYLKTYVYADDRWMTRRWLPSRRTRSDLGFFKEMTARARTVEDQGRFKFFHLRGLHAPLSFDENLVERHLPISKPAYKGQAMGFMTLLQRFLDDIRKLGIYDRSMIVIASDHGTSGYGVYVNVKASGRDEGWQPNYAVRTDMSIVESGIPLVLIKPFQSDGELRISDAPITHADLPRTITDALGLSAFKDLLSVQDVDGRVHRRRRFLSYVWSAAKERDAYFPALDEYWVEGFSWLRSSWHPSFRKFTGTGIVDVRPSALSPPATLAFGVGGSATPYLGMGWAAADKDFCWTEGTRAAVILPLRTSAATVRMIASLTPLTGPQRKSQRVRTLVNGRLVEEWTVSAPGEYQATLSGDVAPHSDTRIEFQLPDAVSPTELGLSDDSRKLAVGFSRVQFSPVPYYEYGTTLTFGSGGNARIYQESGWAAPDSDFTWTEGHAAHIELPVRTSASLRLSALVTPLIADKGVQRVVVKADDHVVDVWNVGAAGTYTAAIPEELVTGSMVRLRFELPDAISPQALNGSPDPRLLGVAFRTLSLMPMRTVSKFDDYTFLY